MGSHYCGRPFFMYEAPTAGEGASLYSLFSSSADVYKDLCLHDICKDRDHLYHGKDRRLYHYDNAGGMGHRSLCHGGNDYCHNRKRPIRIWARSKTLEYLLDQYLYNLFKMVKSVSRNYKLN